MAGTCSATAIAGDVSTCTAAILKHQPVRRSNGLWFANVDFETGKALDTEQDELGSFYGGLLAQGGAVSDGARIRAAGRGFRPVMECFRKASTSPI